MCYGVCQEVFVVESRYPSMLIDFHFFFIVDRLIKLGAVLIASLVKFLISVFHLICNGVKSKYE